MTNSKEGVHQVAIDVFKAMVPEQHSVVLGYLLRSHQDQFCDIVQVPIGTKNFSKMLQCGLRN